MDKKLETDNLEMRLQALESRIYGERRSKSGKPVKVRPEYCLLYVEWVASKEARPLLALGELAMASVSGNE